MRNYCKICKKLQSSSNGPFFKVTNEDRRLKWSKICGIDFRRHQIVCSDHFNPSHIINAGGRVLLLPNAVPIMPATGPGALYPAPFDANVKTQLMETEIVSAEIKSEIPIKLEYKDINNQTDLKDLEYALDRESNIVEIRGLKNK